MALLVNSQNVKVFVAGVVAGYHWARTELQRFR